MSATIPLIKDCATILKEEGFDAKDFFKKAALIGAIALIVFNFYAQAAFVLLGIATWCLFSSVIIVLADVSSGSFLEPYINAIYSICMEINAIFYALVLFPQTLWSAYHLPTKEDLNKGTPILMVNGWLSFGSTWDFQRKYLKDKGLGPIYTMNVGSGESIKTYAEYVKIKIEEIQKETEGEKIILIGHSKGGLVSSYCATYLTEKLTTTITHVVTIGSPFKGAPIAHIGIGDDVQEMRPNSTFLQDLADKITACTRTKFLHIASEVDLISHSSSALLGENRENHFLLKNLGHLSLVFSSRVAEKIHDWLAGSIHLS